MVCYGTLTVCVGVAVALLAAVVLVLRNRKRPASSARWLPDETFFFDPNKNKEVNFSQTIYDEPTLTLSVIIPAYNEKLRLPVMLNDTLSVLKKRRNADPSFTFEILIVDDGSSDDTTKVGLEYSKREGADVVRVLTLFRNRGKGGAIKRGMMYGRGQYLLFADADGATQFEDLTNLETALKSISKPPTYHGLALGSRAHLEEKADVKRKFHRVILMWGFYILRAVLCVRGVADTQCGFKLFTHNTARLLFPNMHIERWAFDVELLYIAVSQNIPIKEVAVRWREIDGSKVSPLASSLQMARDLFRIRMMYVLGFWRLDYQ